MATISLERSKECEQIRELFKEKRRDYVIKIVHSFHGFHHC